MTSKILDEKSMQVQILPRSPLNNSSCTMKPKKPHHATLPAPPPPPARCLLPHPAEPAVGSTSLSDQLSAVPYNWHPGSRTLTLTIPTLLRRVEIVRFLRFSSGDIRLSRILLRP